jgi:hypothetical protein
MVMVAACATSTSAPNENDDRSGGATPPPNAGSGGASVQSGAGGAAHGSGGSVAIDAGAPPTPATRADAGGDAAMQPARDAAPPSNGGFLGESRCGAAGLALCDDFEGDTPDSTLWKVITSYSGQPSEANHVTIDAEHAARGARALHVHTQTNDPVYIETLALPKAGNTFFGRVLAYFDADPGMNTRGHWGAFVGMGKAAMQGAQDIEVRIGGQFDILVVNYSPNDALQTSASRDGFYDDGMRLPIRTWTCFEFEFDGGADELRVWIDGAEIDRLHVTDWSQFGHGLTPDWSPEYDRLRIGYQSWNADTPIDVWYDAVAIDTQPIGCAR